MGSHEVRSIGLDVASLLVEELKLCQQGNSFEILSESPSEVRKETTVEVGVEDHCYHEGHCNKVVTLDDIEVILVAALEFGGD